VENMLKALPRPFLYIHEFFTRIKRKLYYSVHFAEECSLESITALFILFHQVFAGWALLRPFLYIHGIFSK
jgi:hypothetical protein